MTKKKEIKAVVNKCVVSDHLHGTYVPKYTKIKNKWFCRTCGEDVTGLPLLSVTYKRA